jgi:maltose O-acetyltransferase
MIKRILKSVKFRLGMISSGELNVEACVKLGMKVGKNNHGIAACMLDYAHCWLIEVGDNVTFAPEVYLLAHDASTQKLIDYTKVGKVVIEDNVFIGARALIMPGVRVGKNAIVAAGSIVTKSVPENTVVGGNPARFITTVAEYTKKHQELIKTAPVYDESYLIQGGVTQEMREKMATDLENTIGYVV